MENLWRSNLARLGLGAVFSALTLYLALREVDLAQARAALANVNTAWVGLAVLSVGFNLVARTVRWQALMDDPHRRLPFGLALRGLLLGMTLNLLVPARVGDISRAYLGGTNAPGRVFALGTVALEKILDLVAYAVLLVALLIMMPLPAWAGSSAYSLAALALVFGLALVLLTRHRLQVAQFIKSSLIRLPERIQKPIDENLEPGFASLEVMTRRRALLGLAFWSIVIWGSGLLTNHLTLLAFNLALPLTASLLILVVLQVGITLPSVPGRVGIFEFLCVLSLAFFGVTGSTAFSYGVLLHIISMVPIFVTAALAFWFFRFSQ